MAKDDNLYDYKKDEEKKKKRKIFTLSTCCCCVLLGFIMALIISKLVDENNQKTRNEILSKLYPYDGTKEREDYVLGRCLVLQHSYKIIDCEENICYRWKAKVTFSKDGEEFDQVMTIENHILNTKNSDLMYNLDQMSNQKIFVCGHGEDTQWFVHLKDINHQLLNLIDFPKRPEYKNVLIEIFHNFWMRKVIMLLFLTIIFCIFCV